MSLRAASKSPSALEPTTHAARSWSPSVGDKRCTSASRYASITGRVSPSAPGGARPARGKGLRPIASAPRHTFAIALRRDGKRAPAPDGGIVIDLEQARRRAKELQRSGKLPKLADAQHRVANELGFSSWPALIRHMEDQVVLAALSGR